MSSKHSSSSAVELSGTPTGLAASVPSVPPSPTDGQITFTRRRASWARADTGQDPLHLNLSSVQPSSPSSSNRMVAPTAQTSVVFPVNDDPFYSPTEDVTPFTRDSSYATSTTRYGSLNDSYSTSQAGPSTISLMRQPTGFEMDGVMEDDKVHLATDKSRNPTQGSWDQVYDEDTEQSAGTAVRSDSKTVRYSSTPSQLKKTRTTIKNVSQNLRRISLRVVNLAGVGLENHIRLPSVDDDEAYGTRSVVEGRDSGEGDEGVFPDLSKNLPIRGRTLGFLGSDSKFRLALFKFLVFPWTEPIILILIITNAILLTIQASHTSTLPTSDGTSLPPQVKGYFHSWEDYGLFVLFVVFTIESLARICVSGFLLDPEVPTSVLFTSLFSAQPATSATTSANLNPSISRQASLIHSQGPPSHGLSVTQRIDRLGRNYLRPFILDPGFRAAQYPNDGPVADQHTQLRTVPTENNITSGLRSDRDDSISLPFRLNVTQIHDKTRRNLPYLRHSWSRIDFVAVVSFWVTFLLATIGVERGSHHIGIFRAMSVLRTSRLLAITSGTTTIMHSLKRARPLLTSVAYFVLFAMVLFSIIGIQSFKGSLRRACYLSPTLGESQIQVGNQFCGGHIDPTTLNVTSYVQSTGTNGETPKGYICPLGQTCQEQTNPMGNVESFDTIYNAALQVVVVASANGWSPLMYSVIDSEFFISCFFFIACVIVLNFWLINLFVAVITNTFSAIRKETKKSAFGAAPPIPIVDEQDDSWAAVDGRKAAKTNIARTVYEYTRWCWVLLALASLVLQATRTVDVSDMHEILLYYGELGITIAFDVEIVLRVLATLPDWRSFFAHGNNWLDATLAVGCSVIQIPVIQRSSIYPWFTIFQLARFYRVILEVPRMRPLLLAVFGNVYGLASMSLFLILINYIAALVAVQLLRGDLGQNVPMNFGQLFTAFLAIYQVFSSENWTNVLYGTSQAETQLGQTVIVVLFITSWLLFANFIVLQMFIAVINENFDVAEESKKGKQASSYWATHQAQEGKATWFRRLNPYRWLKPNPVKVKVEHLPADLVLPMQKTLVQDYNIPRPDGGASLARSMAGSLRGARYYSTKSLRALRHLFDGEARSNDIPLVTLRHARSETLPTVDPNDEEIERHLDLLNAINSDGATSEETNDAVYERRAQKADFIRDHPSYDKTFWVFSQKHILRQTCQKLVQPANGERIFGTPPSPIAHPLFQLLLLLAVIGGIVVEGIATPMYRRKYFLQHGFSRGAWFNVAETAFGFTLLVEFVIKITADGFAFTPNAYIRSIWNLLDFIILIGLLVNLTTTLIFVNGLSRIARSLKALRALRLITLIEKMRNTFESLIISGAIRILDAAILAILYMIPYAVWGLNIFAGKMAECNDTSASGISDCTNEYTNTVFGNSFGFLAPRVWNDPAPSTTFSFDSFRSSLLILFEIVSLEGWIDVMTVATSITGRGQQPQTNASQFNAIFFLIYHLSGGIVILTLFVSIIIGNFSSKAGFAFLTKPQREWIDLQKLFKRQRPSKRPRTRPTSPVRAWCFDRAVQKHGWWSRSMTFLFVLHIFALMTQTFSTQNVADTIRNDFFLIITFVYIIDAAVRCFGLGWRSFRANGWNLFDIIVAGGSFVTTLVVRFGSPGFVIDQLQKLFLVSIAFKLVQRSNNLNQLFKTSVASLPIILSLLGLWLILFIFFAILYVEVFSMTKWNSAETRNQNYSTMGSALVMLAFMSTGEGWNQYMHDFALVYPRCTDSSPLQPESDCGSVGWAFTLFIAWNLLSMYIFANMFTGVVVESFSYVFQASAGGAKSVTREQMRAFKKVWAEFANPRTGYLERNCFVPFFARLSGVFEVRIYPLEHTIPNILAACKESSEAEYAWPSRIIDGIDVSKLEKVLGTIDYASIRKRRAIYSRLYHEASISHYHGRGISFTDMLLLLAHHKLIVDREALVLKDLVVRTETNKLVTDLVNLDRVKSLLKMLPLRRRFLADRERMRSMKLGQQDIPSIVVEVLPESPPLPAGEIATLGHDNSVTGSAPGSPSPGDSRFYSPDASLGLDTKSGAAVQRSSRRASAMSVSSADHSYRSTDSALSGEDTNNVLLSMQNSIWGGMMVEAAEEEER